MSWFFFGGSWPLHSLSDVQLYGIKRSQIESPRNVFLFLRGLEGVSTLGEELHLEVSFFFLAYQGFITVAS